ncbi:MAG: sugar phosphate isomerase/epimerase family protein [Spirochaetales bacterium]
MKYGFMTFSFPRASVSTLIEEAIQAGYTGIELRIGRNQGHGLEIDSTHKTRSEALSKAKEAGIDLYSLASSFQLAVEPLDEQEARATIELADDLEARVIRVFGGPFQDSGLSREEARAQLVAGLKRFGELSAKESKNSPVVIALESHDAWTEPELLAGIIDEVGMPHVGLNWDPYHIVRTTDQGVRQHFDTIKRYVVHTHVHDGKKSDGAPVLCSIGNGIVDHREMLECLKSISYDGYLMGEWIDSLMEGSTDPIEYLPRELKKLKRIEAELG